MYATDFEYDGQMLSDFGFMVTSIGGQSGVSMENKGAEISFLTSPMQAGKHFVPVGSKYEKCLETSFHICKDPEFFDKDKMEISTEEFRALGRWLNRREFLWFHAIDLSNYGDALPWVRASFTLARIDVSGTTYGIELHMTTDSPFCYGEEIVKQFSFTTGALSKILIDENDEIGETFPQMTITCSEAGTLVLCDDVTGCECSIENCVEGEVITFGGETKIVSTSNVAHNIADDFNYDFFCFGNTYGNNKNTITTSMPCTVEIRYRPIYKDTL